MASSSHSLPLRLLLPQVHVALGTLLGLVSSLETLSEVSPPSPLVLRSSPPEQLSCRPSSQLLLVIQVTGPLALPESGHPSPLTAGEESPALFITLPS